jgi:hypothetical protein
MGQITEKDRAMARRCVECPVCRAYEKVYGRKAHEPAP